MISIGANSNKIAYGIKHYNIDTLNELYTINTANETMGTTAFVIENSTYYMLNGSKEWKKINPYGNNNPTPDIDNTVIYEGGGV